jgi:hypothetical protein
MAKEGSCGCLLSEKEKKELKTNIKAQEPCRANTQ